MLVLISVMAIWLLYKIQESITNKIQTKISKANHSGKWHSRFLVLISPLSQCTFLVCCKTHLNQRTLFHWTVEYLHSFSHVQNLISSELQIYKLHFLFIKGRKLKLLDWSSANTEAGEDFKLCWIISQIP